MKTGTRIAGLAVIAAGAAILAWGLYAPLPKLSPEIAGRKPDAAHGAYLAAAGDCTACHTRPGGDPFAGGLPFVTPLGVIYSTNITPDHGNGIGDGGDGDYTLPEFIRLMRQGVARDGRRVYPAMPYPAFAKIDDADLQDIFAYFQQSVHPSGAPNRRSDIPWPLSIRWPLSFWNKLFLDEARFRPDTAHDETWNRGAYLVEGLGHCGTCHTPRGLAFQEKANADDGKFYLSGALLDGQSVSNLRGNAWTGLGNWSEADIVELLKTARTAHAAVTGQMSEVVENSTQHLNDGDLRAIALYLKSLSPAAGLPNGFAASGVTYAKIMAGGDKDPGARIYMDSCAACHRLDGQGYDHAFPRLAGNATVLHPDPDSLIAVVLNGARLPSTADAPSRLAMPAFGWRYSDAEVAELASFVRSAWGNQAAAVTEDQVMRIRKQSQDPARQP